MNERMSQPEGRAIYARRKTIVEQIKNSGFRGFGVRGKEKVAGEFSLVCVAHNLKKIIFAALRGEVCPRETGGLGKKGAMRTHEVKNRPLSAFFESKIEQKPEFNGFEGRDSMAANERCHGRTSLSPSAS